MLVLSTKTVRPVTFAQLRMRLRHLEEQGLARFEGSERTMLLLAATFTGRGRAALADAESLILVVDEMRAALLPGR